jgi:hypothetical protein
VNFPRLGKAAMIFSPRLGKFLPGFSNPWETHWFWFPTLGKSDCGLDRGAFFPMLSRRSRRASRERKK